MYVNFWEASFIKKEMTGARCCFFFEEKERGGISSREIKWMRENVCFIFEGEKNQLNLIQQFNGVKKRRKKEHNFM